MLMKFCKKRILSLSAALLFFTSMLGSHFTASAAPLQFTDSYILAYDQGGVAQYAYFSPFVPQLTYNNEKVDGYSILFGLKNVISGEIFENAYCTDLPVDAERSNYQHLNLTDSSYAAAHADQLRAIVLGSYPYISLENLQNVSGIPQLSVYEAITATQLAVWKTAHGNNIQINDFLSRTGGAYTSSGHPKSAIEEANAYRTGSEEYKAAVKSRIESLYYYLMSLEGRPALAKVISSSAFTKRSSQPTITVNEDGSCNVTVFAEVNIPAASNVTLTAYIGDGSYFAQTALAEGSKEYTLTISNVPASKAYDPVILSIDGTQTVAEDVFLLDAKGLRGASQSMIAPMSGTIPVHAEIKAEPDRILELYKKSNEDGSPLKNISFEIYYVGTLDSFLNGTLGIDSTPTADDLRKYAVSTGLVGTITTDQNGYGKMNFSTEDGVYLVKELPNDLVEDSTAFFVTLPDYSRCDENGTPSYTITASPKNTVKKDKIEVEKDVTKTDNEHDTFDIGEDHTWIIQSSIPNSIASGTEYKISDTLDRRLTLKSVDQVTLAKDTGSFGNSEDPAYIKDENETLPGRESVIFEKDTDYKIHISKTESGEDSFTVSLTSAGIQKAAASSADSKSDYELRIYFTAQINTNAAMGENIPNKAHVSYTNALDQTYTSDSDQPEVHTGGIKLLKIDSNTNEALKNAVFTVWRETSNEDLIADREYQEIKIEGTLRKLIQVSFYDDPLMQGEKTALLTTDQHGEGYIYGLAYGDYYLIETQAPDGYNKLNTPQKFTISAVSHTEENKLIVKNTAGVLLPSTGGMGTQIFTVSGLILSFGAALLLFKRKYWR